MFRRIKAFTLVELLVVLAIIALLLSLAVPRYFQSIEKSKETVLRDNLSLTRQALDKYYGDNGKYPDSLDMLVNKKYLRSLPVDPITDSSTTWIVVPPDVPEKGGVYDLKSGAPGKARDGTEYKDW
ncbi:type II secretion system pseudopilin OxpG [Sulfurimicrobium lacus]|uniref:Type II secretion system pseudopilin OxpG n=1 Tax=Sulfurimicrobium lacus TaxID=2715678 RepID=A0A6F8VET3_9PROT|nr:prepilin-type N-terminal cleavage/methylation domain-containing protein [Sulfurimicrobium lacus]BCB27607.1 type II secretion system pseudopilin OxpG [Sulfurimicrobium lacus]